MQKTSMTKEEFLLKAIRVNIMDLEAVSAFIETINDDYIVDLQFHIRYDHMKERVCGYFMWENHDVESSKGIETIIVTVIGDPMFK